MVPVMVTVTVLGVPSMLCTLKVSTYVSPTFNSSKAALAVKSQAPLAARLKVPYVPATPVCATKLLSGLSGSVAVRVPEVLIAASVSATETDAEDTVAASLVPVMVSVTVAGALAAPSLSVAVKVKLTSRLSPTFRSSKSLPGSKL